MKVRWQSRQMWISVNNDSTLLTVSCPPHVGHGGSESGSSLIDNESSEPVSSKVLMQINPKDARTHGAGLEGAMLGPIPTS
jgi:hypothetical protein